MSNLSTNTIEKPDSAAEPVRMNQPGDYPEVQYKVRPKSMKPTRDREEEGKLPRLMRYLQGVKDQNFTGYIKVNFTQGSIGRIERFEEILRR